MSKSSMKKIYIQSVINQVAKRGLENLRIKNIADERVRNIVWGLVDSSVKNLYKFYVVEEVS